MLFQVIILLIALLVYSGDRPLAREPERPTGTPTARSPTVRPVERSHVGLTPLKAEALPSIAGRMGIPVTWLILVLSQERGRLGECLGNVARDGTIWSWDCGPLGINDMHSPQLGQLLGMDPILVRQRLRDDFPFNAWVAAHRLRSLVGRNPSATACEIIGLYHSATPGPKTRYQKSIAAAEHKLRITTPQLFTQPICAGF